MKKNNLLLVSAYNGLASTFPPKMFLSSIVKIFSSCWNKKRMMHFLGVRSLLLFAACCFATQLFLTGCASPRETLYVPVESKVTEIVTLHDTTVVVKLVPYKDSVDIIAPNTGMIKPSYLYNEYAYSYASYSGGILHHSLGIFPTAKILHNMQIPTVKRLEQKTQIQPVVSKPEVKYINKLHRWQKYLIWCGVAFHGLLVIGFFVLLKKTGVLSGIWYIIKHLPPPG